MKERRAIDIEHLIIDEYNPRFEAVSTEEDALLSILEDQAVASGNKVLNLARDIAANGLNASELLIVSPIEGTDNYRIREGNRRVTAIQLSLHSDQIPERFSDLSTQFEELANAMQQHRLVNCYVCDDEDEIRRLLILRHGGENGGVGTVKWNATQKARFSHRGNQQSARALSLIEHLQEQYGQGELWSAAAEIPATNLGRFISTPEVRQALNITAVGNDARYLGEHDDLLLDVFKKVKNGGVGPIHSKDDRIRLVEEAAQRIEPDRLRQPRLPFDGTAANESNAQSFEIGNGPTSCRDQDYKSVSDDRADDARINSHAGTPAHPQEVEYAPELAPTDLGEISEFVPDKKQTGNLGLSEPVRRKPVSRNADRKMFVHALRPKGAGSNDVYRGIDWIDEQYLKNPDALGHLLPILGFSLRLLIENVAREYFASIGEDHGDKSLSNFLKVIAKPAIRQKLDTVGRNNMALASEWIDDTYNFEALFAKWAHGTLAVDRSALVRQSELVALIISEVWT